MNGRRREDSRGEQKNGRREGRARKRCERPDAAESDQYFTRLTVSRNWSCFPGHMISSPVPEAAASLCGLASRGPGTSRLSAPQRSRVDKHT